MADKDKTELRMNLGAVKKYDPYAKDIIDTSSHVAFYTFNSELNEWEKTNVEGAFFVYSRNAEPYHSIFVNNRLNTSNLVEPITSDIEIQTQPPFLLYRNERTKIRGFWFYNLAECERIAELVTKLVDNCKKSRSKMDGPQPGKSTAMQPLPMGNGVDIFSMLSKAQEDFNNSITSTPNTPGTAMAPQNISATGQQQSTQHLQQQPPDVTSSVMSFFAAAKPNPPEVPIFQRMLSNPVPVEQIEKQQRASTPETNKQRSPPADTKNLVQQLAANHHHLHNNNHSSSSTKLGANGLENGLKLMRINGSPNNHKYAAELGSSPLATFLNSSSIVHRTPNQSLVNATDVSELESRQKPLNQLLRKTSDALPNSLGGASPGKPALLLPNMFASPSSNTNSLINNLKNSIGSDQGPIEPISPTSDPLNSITIPTSSSSIFHHNNHQHHNHHQVQQQQQQALLASVASSLPHHHHHHLNHNHNHHQNHNANDLLHQIPSSATKPEPLTQSQLLQAMQYLIKNDPDFVKKLHEAYLNSFTEMMS